MSRTTIIARLEALSAGESRIITARPLRPFLRRPTFTPAGSPAPARARISTAAQQVDSDQPPASQSSAEHERVQKEAQVYAKKTLKEAVEAKAPRQDWTRKEIAAIYYRPLMELVYQAVSPH